MIASCWISDPKWLSMPGTSASPKDCKATVERTAFPLSAQHSSGLAQDTWENGPSWVKSLLCQAEQGFRPTSFNSPTLTHTYKLSVYLSPLLQKIFWVKGKNKKEQNVRNTEVAATGYLTPLSCPECNYKHTCTRTHQLPCK